MTADDLFIVWETDDIDSGFYEETDDPRPLYVCLLCRDTDGTPDLIRGYSPRDGIFERPGCVVESVGGIDLAGADDPYKREIESELVAEFEARRDAAIVRGEN